MQGEEIIAQQFDTQLPYLKMDEPHDTQDSNYVDFLYDSINPSPPSSTFIFQLKDIIIEDTVAISDTIVKEMPSVFFPYKSEPIKISPKFRDYQAYDWLTLLLLLCLGILAWIKYEGGRRVSQLFRAVFARHNMNQLLRDGDIFHERITPGLMFISLITYSTAVSLLIRPYNIEFPGADSSFQQFSIVAGVILSLWMLKLVIIKLSGILFRTRNETNEYLITNIIFNVASGLIAFPFAFSAHYTDNSIILWISILIIIVGLLMKFIRSIFVGLSTQSFPVVYIFLYLCTLEILPVLVIYKLIVN
jgi:hypothetical protein